MKKRFLYPLIMPVVLIAIQAIVMLVGFLLRGDERAMWTWAFYGFGTLMFSFSVFFIAVFPAVSFRYGRRLSDLGRLMPKLLFSAYNAILATSSFILLLFWLSFSLRDVLFVLSLFVWFFLWTFIPALYRRNTAPVDVDAAEIENLRKLRSNKEYL